MEIEKLVKEEVNKELREKEKVTKVDTNVKVVSNDTPKRKFLLQLMLLSKKRKRKRRKKAAENKVRKARTTN